jgi:4-carboxymuconolactone decarboxylase
MDAVCIEDEPMKKHIAWSTVAVIAAAAGFLAGANTPAKSREPRFAQLTMAQMDAQQKPLADYVMKISAVGIGGPYNILLRSPGAAKPTLDLLDYLRFHTSVPTRLNEFAILIQGRLWRSQVEWHTHPRLALRAGLSEKTIAELKANRRPSEMQPDEAAVYDFCMELFTRHAVSDETFEHVHHYLNDQQIIDLTMVSGTYVTVASLLAMGEQGPPPGEPLAFQPGDP